MRILKIGKRSIFFGVFVLCGLCLATVELVQSHSKPLTSQPSDPFTEAASHRQVVPPPGFELESSLTIKDIMDWDLLYGDLIGRDAKAATDKFGAPSEIRDQMFTWEASPKTYSRHVIVLVRHDKIVFIKIRATIWDSIDAREILNRADQFKFSTGHYANSLIPYLLAERIDGHSIFRFLIGEEKGPIFESVIFKENSFPSPR